MMIALTDYNGNKASIRADSVIKIRESFLAEEPKSSIFIDYATNGVFVRGKFEAICDEFSHHIRIARLHLPGGRAVALNADGISGVQVSPKVGGKPLYRGNCVAIVDDDHWNERVEARNMIALEETVEEATAILAAA